MPDLPVLDGFLLVAAALLMIVTVALRGISRAKPKPKPEPPRSKSAEVAVQIITDQAKKDQAKINEARADGDKLAELLNDRRRPR